MTGSKGNWLTAMEEVLRSPSPARSFDMPLSPAPSQGPRQSVDNFLSRLGPGMLDNSFDLEERSGQPRRSSGRKSHEMNVCKGTMDQAKQVQSNNNHPHNISNNKNNSNVGKASNKLHLQSSNNNKRQLETQSNKPQGGSVSNLKIKGGNNMRGVNVEQEQNNRHARAVAAASAAAAEAAAVAAQAAAEVMRLTQSGFASPFSGKRSPSLDDLHLHNFFLASHAATLIQSAYRGHLARQALRALKGLVKLQAVVRGHLVRRQAQISLRCMQALVRLQARVRARQVKAAFMFEEADKHTAKHSGDPQVRHTHNHKLHEMGTQRQHLSTPTPNISARSPTGLMLRGTESLHTFYHHHHSHHNRVLDTFSRASSVISSEDSRDWDNSALSKEKMELKILKKQHALAMRQKALSYAETHQRTPTRSSRTPTQRISNDYYQPQQQKFSRLSFNETEPENLHRDWSWLEGWMAAHGATSVWESNAAALWESRDERRDRGDDKEEQYGYLYEEDEVEEREEEEASARTFSNSLFHDHCNSDDDPAIKIIEMDCIATPRSSLAYPLHFISASPSPTRHPFSTRHIQHFTSHIGNVHHHPLHHSHLHYGSVSHHSVTPLSPPAAGF